MSRLRMAPLRDRPRSRYGGGTEMGVLIEGVWRDEELPQEVGRAGEFRRARAGSANASRRTARRVSKQRPGAITSTLPTVVPGRTAP